MKKINEKLQNYALISLMRDRISVIPVGKDKIPLIPWKEFQTRFATPEEVQEWFQRFDDPQIGFCTGPLSNLAVVDVEEGGTWDWLPQDTLIVETGGKGRHFYFRYTDGINNKARIKELCDIRGLGGYVVSPNSVSSKGPYTILKDRPLLPFPKELFPTKVDAFSLPMTSNQQVFVKKEIDSYTGFGPGQRNDEMARYIGYVLTQMHPADWDSNGWQIIQAANQRNTPPLGANELIATFNSIKSTERRKNPLGRSTGSVASPEVILPTDGSDEIKHISDVAAEQTLDQSDIYPLEMPCFDDVILGGVAPGDLVVVAGQSGHGKTSLVQDWTLSLVRGEKKPKSLWFSYEVLPTHLWKKFSEMGMTKEDCAYIPCKNTSGNIAWVEAKIKEGKEKFGTKMVMIDHLGFLLPKTNGTLGTKGMSSNYSTFLTQVVRDLKTIALKEEVIIFLPVHMRKAEKGSKRSDIDDIKDSSGVAQEADLVFLIEREKDKDNNAKSYFTDVTKITLAKNRKTGQTVIANFTMIKNRFCYDDTADKANAEFDKFGKNVPEIKVAEVQQAMVIPPVVVPVVAPVVIEKEEGMWDNLEDYMEPVDD